MSSDFDLLPEMTVPMTAGVLAAAVDRPLREVMGSLWRLNSAGYVRLTPGSKWEKVPGTEPVGRYAGGPFPCYTEGLSHTHTYRDERERRRAAEADNEALLDLLRRVSAVVTEADLDSRDEDGGLLLEEIRAAIAKADKERSDA